MLDDRYKLVMKRELKALRGIHAAAVSVEAARKSGAKETLDAMLDDLSNALERYKSIVGGKRERGS